VTDPNSVYMRINRVFESMPLACLIDDKILCVHSGIGNKLKSVQDIDRLQRPIKIVKDVQVYNQSILLDLLWSDPFIKENNV